MNSPVRLLFAAALLSGARVLFGAETVLLPTSDNIGVYRNEVRHVFETPLFTVSTADRLLVLDTRADKHRIRDQNGREGWVEKRSCVRAPRGTRFSFDPAVVTTDWGVRGFGVVSGDSPLPDDTIALHRSFAGELRVNMDREEAQRTADF